MHFVERFRPNRDYYNAAEFLVRGRIVLPNP